MCASSLRNWERTSYGLLRITIFIKNGFFFQITRENIELYLSAKFAYFPHKSQKELNSIKLLCVNKS
ncbi:hypothetical protein DKC15_005170 [Acinetobacter pittii]|nr:hypothetical protein DKC15_005170 [Acinetobacter pittii]PPC02427.1 hypothetical protein ApiMCR53_05455 [Acinetobacter pittii]